MMRDDILGPQFGPQVYRSSPGRCYHSFRMYIYVCPIVFVFNIQLSNTVLLAYVFQTLFTALIPSLFYFSIWELGIAGQELALLSVLSPFFLGVSSIYAFAKSQSGQVILQSLSITGLFAYLLDDPLQRLVIVTPAVALGSLAAAAQWTENDGCYRAIGMFSCCED